jgi:hypothetical protein
MKKIVEFDLADGSVAYMEVEDTRPSALRKAGGAKGEETRKAGSLAKALRYVRPAAEAVVNSLREVNTPAEIALEFSLKFSSEVGSFLFASADAEATFKVALKWTNEPPAAARS